MMEGKMRQDLDAERFEEAVRSIPPHIILEMGCKEEFGAQGFEEFKEAVESMASDDDFDRLL